MANIKKMADIPELTEVVGDESIVGISRGSVVRIPVSSIGGNTGSIVGGHVIDITAEDFNPEDPACGDAILELVRSGASLWVYDGTVYGTVVAVRRAGYNNINTDKLQVSYIDAYGTSGTTGAYTTGSDTLLVAFTLPEE